MKSNKQRRTEIKAKRANRKSAKEQAMKYDVRLKTVANAIPVNAKSLGHNCSYGVPNFVERGFYLDQHFVCKDCGIVQTWAATQQKWWYEVIKGDVWTTAVRCRPCRKKEAERKFLARTVHLEGIKMKREKQLIKSI